VIEEEEIAKENIAKGLPASKEESEKSIKVSPNDVFKISAGSEVYSEFKRDEFIKARDAALERGFKRTGIDLPVFGIEQDKNLEPSKIVLTLDNVSDH